MWKNSSVFLKKKKKKKNLCVNNIVVDAEIRVAYSFSKCTFKDSKRT